MELKNATINFLGDSITEGAGASRRENRYTDVLAREFGLKAANNYGIGGTRIARQHTPTRDNPQFDQDFCLRLKQMDESADGVVVMGGVNDYGHGDAPIGAPGDQTPETFWGACYYLMDALQSRYCGKPVLIVTPLHCGNDRAPKAGYPGVVTLDTYRQILLSTAEYFALPVLDLYAQSGMQPDHPVCRETLMPDALHPNDAGHALVARKIGNFLKLL